jgi:hypothetical protein
MKRYNAAYGALFVTASSTAMNFEFRNTAGALIDSYAVAKRTTQSTTFDWKVCC